MEAGRRTQQPKPRLRDSCLPDWVAGVVKVFVPHGTMVSAALASELLCGRVLHGRAYVERSDPRSGPSF
jgi:hypothetical protein